MAERYRLEGARELRTYFEAWRNSKGYTQQEVADRMGTTKQTVSRVETGARDWGKGFLEGFAHVIGCHPLAPLLTPPVEGVDVNELLLGLERAGQATPENLTKAARALRSLVHPAPPAPRPAAREPLKTKVG